MSIQSSLLLLFIFLVLLHPIRLILLALLVLFRSLLPPLPALPSLFFPSNFPSLVLHCLEMTLFGRQEVRIQLLRDFSLVAFIAETAWISPTWASRFQKPVTYNMRYLSELRFA